MYKKITHDKTLSNSCGYKLVNWKIHMCIRVPEVKKHEHRIWKAYTDTEIP